MPLSPPGVEGNSVFRTVTARAGKTPEARATLEQLRSPPDGVVVDYQVEEIPGEDRPDILREYLQRYRSAVQGYFSINADADQEAFEPSQNGTRYSGS